VKRKRVVILGGGFGGLNVALYLAKTAYDLFEIILVDAQEQHLYTPWLYRIPSDLLLKKKQGRFRDCELLFSNILMPYRNKIEFRKATVTGMNKKTKHVLLENGKTISFDYVVVALGSELNDYGIDGVKEYALSVNSVPQIKAMYKSFTDLMLKDQNKQHECNIVVGGGGAVGTEIALDLMHVIRMLGKEDMIHVTVVNSSSALLERFSIYTQKKAKSRSDNLGLKLYSNTAISHASDTNISLRTENDTMKKIPYDLFIWAGGVRSSKIARCFDMQLNIDGRLMVEKTLRVMNETHCFSLGDMAAYPNEKSSTSLPPAAWVAVEQAKIIAENIVRNERGDKLRSYLPPKYYPGIISLGGRYASGELFGIAFSGKIAYIFKQIITLNYFFKILPLHRAVYAWFTRRMTCKI